MIGDARDYLLVIIRRQGAEMIYARIFASLHMSWGREA